MALSVRQRRRKGLWSSGAHWYSSDVFTGNIPKLKVATKLLPSDKTDNQNQEQYDECDYAPLVSYFSVRSRFYQPRYYRVLELQRAEAPK